MASSQDAGNQHEAQQRPLTQAIRQCEARWLHDSLHNALEGDPNHMALVSQMYCTGYGCVKNPSEAQRWVEAANKR